MVEDVAEPLDGDLHLLKILPQLRQPQDRLDRLPGDHVEGDERAHRQLAGHHRMRPEQQGQGGRHLARVLDGVLPAGRLRPDRLDLTSLATKRRRLSDALVPSLSMFML